MIKLYSVANNNILYDELRLFTVFLKGIIRASASKQKMDRMISELRTRPSSLVPILSTKNVKILPPPVSEHSMSPILNNPTL
jgi:hypothetical protein